MANIKSAKKRILVAETKAARNKAIRSKVKTYVKRLKLQLLPVTRLLHRLRSLLLQAKSTRLLPRAYITRILLPEKYPVCPKL